MALEEFKIRASGSTPVHEDIARCLHNLYSAREGSIPLNREFGLDWSILSGPISAAEGDFTLDVITKTAKYESRVSVSEVSYDYSESTEGKVIPTIYLEGSEED